VNKRVNKIVKNVDGPTQMSRRRARPDSAKPTSRPKLLAQNRLVAKRSGAPKRDLLGNYFVPLDLALH
jgi:hypothetical protein